MAIGSPRQAIELVNNLLIDFLPALWVFAEIAHCIRELLPAEVLRDKHRIYNGLSVGRGHRFTRRQWMRPGQREARGCVNLRKTSRISQRVFLFALASDGQSQDDKDTASEFIHAISMQFSSRRI